MNEYMSLVYLLGVCGLVLWSCEGLITRQIFEANWHGVAMLLGESSRRVVAVPLNGLASHQGVRF